MKNLLNVVHDKSLIDEEMIDGYGRPFQDEQIFKAMTRFIRHREGDLEPEQLKKMNKPALLIWARRIELSQWRSVNGCTQICLIPCCTHLARPDIWCLKNGLNLFLNTLLILSNNKKTGAEPVFLRRAGAAVFNE